MKRGLPRQRGVTLVELMVALTLGLLVTLIAATLLVSANASYLSQSEAASLDDGGRFAIEIVTRAVRQAGLADWEGAGPAPAAAPAIMGLDDSVLSRASEGIDDPRGDAVNGSDVLALRFVGAGPSAGGDGSVISCAGFSVGAHEDGWSIFYVARGAGGDAELHCKYRGKSSWGSDAIVGAVDSFQVLYGLDTDEPPDGVPNEYLSATMLDRLDSTLAPPGANATAGARELARHSYWNRVASIRVSLVLHSARPVPPERAPAVFDLFGAAYGDAFGTLDRGTRLREDQLPEPLRRRERKLFSSTVLLRNRSL